MPTKILKNMCRIIGHEWIPMTHACNRCGWVEIYGVRCLPQEVKGVLWYPNLLKPGQGYRVQHRTVVFDQPIAAGMQFEIIIGMGSSPVGIQQFVGDGVRKGFRVKS